MTNRGESICWNRIFFEELRRIYLEAVTSKVVYKELCKIC